MSEGQILITGANGEIGHGLLSRLGQEQAERIIALDLKPLDPALEGYCQNFYQADVLDEQLLTQIAKRHELGTIHHLASILSTRAEQDPEKAHRVNVGGTIRLLKLAADQGAALGRPIKFIYPSSIAVYGLPSVDAKVAAGRVKENEWCAPQTMYGCNKLACEHLGSYYAQHYRRLDGGERSARIDFRAIRFPGLISADTVPTGGTSDYGPEMLHHAARGIAYTCFVRPDTQLPFMAMPDAVRAILALEAAPKERLSQTVYNVTSFSLTAEQILAQTRRFFPAAEVAFEPHPGRQAIVDSWPADVDDGAARRDWDWLPGFDQQAALADYLIPAISARYAAQIAGD